MKLKFTTGIIIGIALGLFTAYSLLKITLHQAEKTQAAFFEALRKGGPIPTP